MNSALVTQANDCNLEQDKQVEAGPFISAARFPVLLISRAVSSLAEPPHHAHLSLSSESKHTLTPLPGVENLWPSKCFRLQPLLQFLPSVLAGVLEGSGPAHLEGQVFSSHSLHPPVSIKECLPKRSLQQVTPVCEARGRAISGSLIGRKAAFK